MPETMTPGHQLSGAVIDHEEGPNGRATARGGARDGGGGLLLRALDLDDSPALRTGEEETARDRRHDGVSRCQWWGR